MTIRMLIVSLSATFVAISAALGCEIHTCEDGATCTDKDWGNDDRHVQCTTYCGRLSTCGAPQAEDFDDCVDACKTRFERLPEETHRLCECAPRSSCGDVIEGRCSPQPGGSGGSCNACATGGASSGNPSGGSAPGGSANASGGDGNPSGGSTVGGASSGSGGASSGTGGDTGTSCQAACDCPVDQACVSGHCVAA